MPSRILAIRGGALGDFIVTLPVLQSLRERFRPERLELLTRPSYGVLAVHFEVADAFRSLDSAAAAALFSDEADPPVEFARWLAGFDLVVAWMTDADGALRRNLQRFCGKEVHVLPPIVTNAPVPAAFQLSAPLRLPIKPFSRPNPSSRFGNRIAIHPGSGSPSKNWPPECWLQAMTDWFRKVPEAEFLLVTGEADERAIRQILPGLVRQGVRFLHLHGATLSALADELSAATLFAGHDSGVSHLAAACGVPCRLLFGPSSAAIWAPPGDHVRTLCAPGRNLAGISVKEALGFFST